MGSQVLVALCSCGHCCNRTVRIGLRCNVDRNVQPGSVAARRHETHSDGVAFFTQCFLEALEDPRAVPWRRPSLPGGDGGGRASAQNGAASPALVSRAEGEDAGGRQHLRRSVRIQHEDGTGPG